MFSFVTKLLDDFLNNTTQYRLVLYVLIALVLQGVLFSFLGILPNSGWNLILSTLFLISVSWLTNTAFAKIVKAPTNLESVYISALILSLIISPAHTPKEWVLLAAAAVLAMASKYVIALHKKHIFNPAAAGIFLTSLLFGSFADWWVGTFAMLPLVTVGGLLILRKLGRLGLFVSFIVGAALMLLLRNDIKSFYVFNTPWLFFASVMLTEPLTTPPQKKWQLIYGGLVGMLFYSPIGAIIPEMALLGGNIWSYLVNPKYKWRLTLTKKTQIAPDMDEFTFSFYNKINFQPGQYLELTLPQAKPDSRGSRRYFTIASSPTENNILFGIKFYPHGSSFKKQLSQLPIGSSLLAGQLAGDFLLPNDSSQKLVFIAGGIGITPFRSMVKYLQDTNQSRDIVLLYSNKTDAEAVYKDIFTHGIKAIYVATETQGRISSEFIQQQIPDFKERKFYLSGPHSLVKAFEENLGGLGVGRQNIVTDFFPGYT